jgi:predicted GIY-YIG superfamily endonuclease
MRYWFFGPRIAGIRTGISIGPEDFARARQPRSAATTNDPNESFLYVVKSDSGLCKIGISSNPNARLAQLRSASAVPLEFAWIGAPKDNTVAIEREAHSMLDKYRRGGEWFAIEPDAAVGAIHSSLTGAVSRCLI